MTDDAWYVSLQQNNPFETVVLEVFTEEEDAIRYAETYMNGRAGHRLFRRRWRLWTDDGSLQLVVWKMPATWPQANKEKT